MQNKSIPKYRICEIPKRSNWGNNFGAVCLTLEDVCVFFFFSIITKYLNFNHLKKKHICTCFKQVILQIPFI